MDRARLRGLGNGVHVAMGRWIGEQIVAAAEVVNDADHW
jgi:hypothetical protein